MIERQAALSIQNAMDISDIISPNVGVDKDVLKMQAVYSTCDPDTYIENLLDFLKGEFAGNLIENNIILRNMKERRLKSLETIRRCLLEDAMCGDFTYDIFRSCVTLSDKREGSINADNNIVSNNPYRYRYQHQHCTPVIDAHEAFIVTMDEQNKSNRSIDPSHSGNDEYNKESVPLDSDDDDDDVVDDDDDDDDNDDSVDYKNDDTDKLERESKGDTETDIINNVVRMLNAILYDEESTRGEIGKRNDPCYIYNHVKNIFKKSQDILQTGECLSCNHQPIEKFLFTLDHNSSTRSMEDLLAQLEGVINFTFPKGESQLSSIEEITVLRIFFKNILLLKTATLVNRYRLFLSFVVTYSISHNLNHNIRVYFQKNRAYNTHCMMDRTVNPNVDQRVVDKFLLSKLSSEESVFILSLLAHFLGPCLETFLCPANLYDAAINYIDSANSEWGKRYVDVSLSSKIKRILDQIATRETFLKERRKRKSINTVIAYMTENRDSDTLLNPLHCIISDIGNVVEIITDGFRDLFIRTTSALNIISTLISPRNK